MSSRVLLCLLLCLLLLGFLLLLLLRLGLLLLAALRLRLSLLRLLLCGAGQPVDHFDLLENIDSFRSLLRG